MLHVRFLSLTAMCAALLAGCAGGGSSGSAPPIPARAAGQARGTLAITVPSPGSGPAISPHDVRRRPAYVSPGTRTVVVYVNGASAPSATVPLPSPSGAP